VRFWDNFFWEKIPKKIREEQFNLSAKIRYLSEIQFQQAGYCLSKEGKICIFKYDIVWLEGCAYAIFIVIFKKVVP